MIYAKSEEQIEEVYTDLKKNEIRCQYPNFIRHFQNLWPRRKEWALCYRKALPVRGNHRNIAKLGIRIVKEIVFGRIKAYNLIQMFQFVTEALELSYKRRLLSIAHNRFDHFIAVKYRGLNANAISED